MLEVVCGFRPDYPFRIKAKKMDVIDLMEDSD